MLLHQEQKTSSPGVHSAQALNTSVDQNQTSFFLREGDGEDRAEALNQAISAIWPDLRDVFWIRVNLHFSWINGHALDDQMEHVVICDDLQFPTFTTWRGGVLELDVTNPGDYQHELHVMASQRESH